MKDKLIVLLFFTFFLTHNISAKTFNTADLSKSAISEDCLDYCIDGACFWLKCSFWGCSINVTPHIKHNLPDFVVTSYDNPGENPYQEFSAIDYTSNIDGGNISSKNKNDSALAFKEVSAIGNPVAYAMGQQRFLCKSEVKPLEPYYLSTIDHKMWRDGNSDMLYASTYTPGMNEVGPILSSWGSKYPRIGFLYQTNDYKTAAVIAERGVEVISQGGLRIYNKPNNLTFKESGKWQMISPKKENQCKVFGYEDHQITLDKKDDDGQYGWTAWLNYSCCIPGSGKLIGTTITGCI
jgi:integrating conjugative element protein (TIGR03756 family)